MRDFVNIALLFFFLTLGITGLLSFFAPFSLVTTRVHVTFGFGVLALVGLHLLSRGQYFLKVLIKRRKGAARRTVPLKMLFSVVGLWAFLLAAALSKWPPVSQFIGIGYEAQHRATIFRPDPKAVFKPIKDGMRVKRATEGAANLLIELEWGPAFPENYQRAGGPFSGSRPQIAIWAESKNGSLIETLFLSEKVAFREHLEWGDHALDRVDVLPIWRHRYTLKTGISPDGDVNAYSGATPEHSFSLNSYLETDADQFNLYVEVNAPNDPNDFFNSSHEPSHSGYMKPGLGQPSIVYATHLKPEDQAKYHLMNRIGHGGSSSKQDGNIHYDLQALTTANRLIEKILVRVERADGSKE